MGEPGEGNEDGISSPHWSRKDGTKYRRLNDVPHFLNAGSGGSLAQIMSYY